jgi:2'-5' RNA ligase
VPHGNPHRLPDPDSVDDHAERTRLFVALELPEAVRAKLVEWRVPILENAAGLRAQAADTMHITLCFLGWQAEAQISPIGDRCAEVLAPRAFEPVGDCCAEVLAPRAFELVSGRGLWLPPRRPRVLAVEIEDPTGTLTRLQVELSQALSAGGWYEPESRPFLPHVTVARAGRSARIRPDAVPAPPRSTFEGSVVTLFRSRLSSSGARYERLRSWG